MSPLLVQYKTRVAELDSYFGFLKNVLEREARLTFPRGRTRQLVPIDEELHKILKANAFLLLYNLVESTVRSGISAVYDAIHEEQLPYTKLRPGFREEWVEQRYVPSETRRNDREVRRMMEFVESVLREEPVSLNSRKMGLDGNVDADQVRIVERRFGFRTNLPEALQGGARLSEVKSERNSLAHGLKSFTECGRDVTYSSLVEIRGQVVPFLRYFLIATDRFVRSRGYAA